MGRIRRWRGWHTLTLVLAGALAVTAVCVATLGPDEQERFLDFLREQPDVVSVADPGRALAVGPPGRPVAARAFRPDAEAVVAHPIDAEVVGRLDRAVTGYAAEHQGVRGLSVLLRQGSDRVLLATDASTNARTITVLGAMRALPSVVTVQADISSETAPFTVTVAAGADLPAAAKALAKSLPDRSTGWFGTSPAVAVRDPVGHEVRVRAGGTVTDSDARAFAVAVRADPAGPLTLITSGPTDGSLRSVIRLPESPRLAATAAALHDSGYGLGRLGESVEGPVGEIPMDETSWAKAAATQLTGVPGVRAARVDVGSAEERRPVVADLRIAPGVSFGRVLEALPAQVERLEAHTSVAAPDYDRDDALAPDPEVDCPAVEDDLNLAYSGPPEALPKAANYLAALRAAASGATCVHWAERGEHGRPQSQVVLIRLPLEQSSWRPVLDVVRARRADLGSAHPDVVLLLPVPGRSWTAVFNLSEGDAPYVSALGTERPGEGRDVEDMLQPLVRYWARG